MYPLFAPVNVLLVNATAIPAAAAAAVVRSMKMSNSAFIPYIGKTPLSTCRTRVSLTSYTLYVHVSGIVIPVLGAVFDQSTSNSALKTVISELPQGFLYT